MAVSQYIKAALKRLRHVWYRSQVSHRGKYSVERLLALEEYTRSTSWLRVLLVCVLLPVPMLVLLLGIESVPIQDPATGWKHKYGMWIRTGVSVIAGTCTIMDQVRQLVPGLQLSMTHVVLISFITAVVYVVVAMALAAAWVFPIPFMSIVMYGPYGVILALSFALVVLRFPVRSIRDSPHDRELLLGYTRFLGAQVLVAVIYPAYNAAGVALTRAVYDGAALLLLPVLRLLMRNVMTSCTAHLEDLIPEASIFTVELFGALYLATTIQRVSSVYSMAVVLAVDAGGLVLSTRSLWKEVDQLTSRTTPITNASVLFPTDALDMPLPQHGKRALAQLRLRSAVYYQLSPAGAARLAAFERLGKFSVSKFRHGHFNGLLAQSTGSFRVGMVAVGRGFAPQCSSKSPRLFSVQIHPSTAIVKQVNKPSRAMGFAEQRALVDRLDRSHQLAFRIKYTALAEYLECVMSVVHLTIMTSMRHLPSHEFHPDLADLSSRGLYHATSSVLIYWAMEMLSFAVLTAILYYRGGVNTLYNVAFVLETHAALVQGKLITWMLIAFESQGVHFGMDFSFEFVWTKGA